MFELSSPQLYEYGLGLSYVGVDMLYFYCSGVRYQWTFSVQDRGADEDALNAFYILDFHMLLLVELLRPPNFVPGCQDLCSIRATVVWP